MVTFLILARLGKAEGAQEFALKSKHLVSELFKKEMQSERALQEGSSQALPQRQNPGGEDSTQREGRISQWNDAAVEALLCSDSDVELIDEEHDASKFR